MPLRVVVLFLCLLASQPRDDMTNDDSTTTTCANEYPGPQDIARVKCPITQKNAQQAFDFLMGIKVVCLLLANQDESGRDIDIDRLKDIGKLLFFLADQPSSVLGELSVSIDDDEPDPGQHKPVLASIGDKQIDAGGAK